MSQSRYQDLCRSLEQAREGFAAYRSKCVLFAGTFTRGFMEYSGWPREQVTYEPVESIEPSEAAAEADQTATVEDAMRLDKDAYWAVGLRLHLEVPKGRDSILVGVRFKALETRFIVSLFGMEDFEMADPTPEGLQPVHESILNAVRRHYDYGLRLFLENGGRGLKIPISTQRLLEMARGSGGAGGAA